jgi:hypothetical protein
MNAYYGRCDEWHVDLEVVFFVTHYLSNSCARFSMNDVSDYTKYGYAIAHSRSTQHSRVGPKRACARRSLGKEERCRKQLKTFRRNPVGHRAHPVESGQHPEVSLASWQATARAKRRQLVIRAGPSSPEIGLVAGAPAVRACGGRACPPVLAREGGPAGVFRSRRGHLGVPQEPGSKLRPMRGSPSARNVSFPIFATANLRAVGAFLKGIGLLV